MPFLSVGVAPGGSAAKSVTSYLYPEFVPAESAVAVRVWVAIIARPKSRPRCRTVRSSVRSPWRERDRLIHRAVDTGPSSSHRVAIPPRQHAYGVATPSSGRRYTIALDAVTTPSRVSMLSPCHHRHAMLSSRLRTVSTLSPRGHHASVTAMPMLSRRHTLATSPPHGCRCSLTSRGRRRRQPHPPRLSCTSSLITSSWLHRAARA